MQQIPQNHLPPVSPNLTVNTSTFRASWSAPSNKGSGGNALKYNVQCKKQGSGWANEASGTTNTYKNLIHTNCKHFTSYIRV